MEKALCGALLALSLLAASLLPGCVHYGVAPAVTAAVAIAPASTPPARCSTPELVYAGDSKLLDPMNFTRVGVLRVRCSAYLGAPQMRDVVTRSAAPVACQWGGTHLMMSDLGSDMLPGYRASWRGNERFVTVNVYRPTTEAERAAQLERAGIGDRALTRKVSFETGCPEEQIVIERKLEERATGSYVVSACGQELHYERQLWTYSKVQ